MFYFLLATKTVYPMRGTCPAYLIILDFITLTILRISSLCNSIYPSFSTINRRMEKCCSPSSRMGLGMWRKADVISYFLNHSKRRETSLSYCSLKNKIFQVYGWCWATNIFRSRKRVKMNCTFQRNGTKAWWVITLNRKPSSAQYWQLYRSKQGLWEEAAPALSD
jgi:hypothetical protein